MQSVHSLFLRRRFRGRKPAAPPGMAAPRWRPADQSSQPFARMLCLRPVCPLSADNADALVAAVLARVRSAVPPPWSVVLDLSATPALSEDAAAALRQLGGLLRDGQASLRLALPAAQARVALADERPDAAMCADTVYLSAHAAVLAACACLPGAAVVTPALRQLLAQPPELLPLPGQLPPQ
jgi:hypothetical protein